MTREKETTIYFADGREADIYRYKPNEYCIEFNDTGEREYGSYLQIFKIIKDYDVNKHDNEENHPMTSCGTYINLWTTGGDYDVFIILHEAEPFEHFEKIMDCNVEDTCHDIVQNKNLSIKEKKKIIETIFSPYVDYEIQFFYVKKEGEN